jgi:hypothetical protein
LKKEKIPCGLRRPKINKKIQQPTKKYAIATKEGKEMMSKSGGEHRGRARALFSQQLSSVDVKNKIK